MMLNNRTNNLDKYTNVFHALANPHRLQIFNILSGCCEPGTACTTDEMLSCCVGDLNKQLNIASSTLSHHLKELNRAGLLHMQREGKQVFCSVNQHTLLEIQNLFASATQVPSQLNNKQVSHGSKTS